MLCLLERLGDDDRHRLSVVMHSVILEYRQIASADTLADLHHVQKRRSLQLRCVLVRDDRDQSGRFFRCGTIDAEDFALRNRAIDELGIRDILDVEFSREARFALDFRRPVDAAERFADVTVFANERVGLFVGNELHDRFHDLLHDAHREPPIPASSRSTLTMVRLASSTLNPLWLKPLALASSAAAARAKFSSEAFAPDKTDSAR